MREHRGVLEEDPPPDSLIVGPGWPKPPSDDSAEPWHRKWVVQREGRGVRGHPARWVRRYEIVQPRPCMYGKHPRVWASGGRRAVCQTCDRRRKLLGRAKRRWLLVLEAVVAWGQLDAVPGIVEVTAGNYAALELRPIPVDRVPTKAEIQERRAVRWRLERALGVAVYKEAAGLYLCSMKTGREKQLLGRNL